MVLRLFYSSHSIGLPDQSFTASRLTLVTEIGVNLSIIVACVPFLNPFMNSLEVGLLSSNLHVEKVTSRSGAQGYGIPLASWKSDQAATLDEPAPSLQQMRGHHRRVSMIGVGGSNGQDDNSQASTYDLNEMITNEAGDLEVNYEHLQSQIV